MNYFSSDSESNARIEICALNLITLFYLFRAAIPGFKIPFLVLYIVYLVYFIFHHKKRIFSNKIEFASNFFLVLLSALMLLISFFSSNKLYLIIFKDVVNAFILISIFFMATIAVRMKNDLKFYISNFVFLTLLFAFVISVSGLFDVLNISSLNSPSLITENDIKGTAESFLIDYNFALIPAFCAIVVVFYFQQKASSRLLIVLFNFLLFVFSFCIILSGSRRGIMLFVVFFLILLFAKFFSLIRKEGYLYRIGFRSGFFLLTGVCIPLLLSLFLFYTSYNFKTQLLEKLGSKSAKVARYNISKNVFRYISVINRRLTFSELLWTTSFDPKEPDSGWGYRNHKTVFPLVGENVEIVPEGAKGYLLDSTCNPSFYKGNNLYESYTLILALNVRKGERYKASVYCFVSDLFEGKTVSFGNTYESVDNRVVTGKTFSFYDLEKKGRWQKLEIEFDCNEGNIPIVLSFTKKKTGNSPALKGSVIFAYPQFVEISGDQRVLIPIIARIKSGTCESEIVDSKDGVNTSNAVALITKFRKKESHYFLSDGVDHAGFQNLSKSITSECGTKKVIFSGLIDLSPFSSNASDYVRNDPDKIRNLVSKFISEDTTYYPYKSNIILDPISNPFIADRLLRWKFALKIFSNEYNWKQKIFGGGFNFLNWYGYYFFGDKLRSDYPHNPFLYILLYSGILGVSLYLFFLYKVFYFYLKYRKEYWIFFVFFLITFFFCFFSSGNPFDPPIMGFFMILPFFIHSVHKKSTSKLNL
jgi:hypothetical protein